MNQKVEDIDEKTIRLTATVPDTKEIRRWLLEFGARAEVIGPEALRSEMKAIIEGMATRYIKCK